MVIDFAGDFDGGGVTAGGPSGGVLRRIQVNLTAAAASAAVIVGVGGSSLRWPGGGDRLLTYPISVW
jgi:hypothetical protein